MVDIQDVNDAAELQRDQKRAKRQQRLQAMIVLLGVLVVIRIVIKDPEPPRSPDHGDKEFKALPGMLALLPEDVKANMDPVQLVQMQQADVKALEGQDFKAPDWKTTKYEPTEIPHDQIEASQEEIKNEIFRYLKKKRQLEMKRNEEKIDRSKKMLVRFGKGRYIKAESTWTKNRQVGIQVDGTMVARIPKNMILSVSNNALTWKEPVPRHQVKLKPAEGITIIVSKSTAKRITVKKKKTYES